MSRWPNNKHPIRTIDKDHTATETRAILFRASQEIVSSLDPEKVCEAIHRAAAQLMPSEAFVITLVDPARQEIELVYAVDQGQRMPTRRIPADSSLSGRIIATGEAVRVDDIEEVSDIDLIHLSEPEFVRSVLAVPMRLGDEVIGMLSAQSYASYAYSLDDEQTLSLLGNQAAIALDNARLFKESQRRMRELSGLYETAIATGSELEIDALLHRLYEQVQKLMAPDAFGIILHNPGTHEFEVALAMEEDETVSEILGRRFSLDEGGFTGWVIRTRQTLLVADVQVNRLPVEPRHVRRPARSWLGVPMVAHDRLIGVISAQSFRARAFSDADRRFLESIASQFAVAVENARLFRAEREQRELAEALREVGAVLSASLDLETVLDRLLAQIGRVVPYDAANISQVEGERTHVARMRGYEQFGADVAQEIVDVSFEIATTPNLRRMVETRQPLVIPDTEVDPGWVRVKASAYLRSWAGAPIILRDEGVIAFFSLHKVEPGFYRPEHAHRLAAFAGQAALALQNARLFAETTQALARERRLNEVARTISGALDLSSLLKNIVRLAAELVGADMGTVALFAPDTDRFVDSYFYHLPEGLDPTTPARDRGLMWHILDTGESLLLSDYGAHPSSLARWKKVGVRGFIGVPIAIAGRPTGVLGLFSTDSSTRFNQRDLRLVESVGRQAGVAIQNARLFSEAQSRTEELVAALIRQEELDCLKSQFIQNTSHELRTPLSIVRGYAELLEAGELGELHADHREPIAIIARRSRILTDLLDDFMVILEAEERQFRLETLSLADLIRKTLIDFQVAAEEAGLALTVEITPDLPMVRGDPIHLHRVLDNLLSNALKFTSAGGIGVRLRGDGADVVLEVTDTGVGIPSDQLERIFERFYQVDGSVTRRYGGTGLGLAVVKEIVEAHGGCVSVQSVLGKGSTFQVRLPVTTSA